MKVLNHKIPKPKQSAEVTSTKQKLAAFNAAHKALSLLSDAERKCVIKATALVHGLRCE